MPMQLLQDRQGLLRVYSLPVEQYSASDIALVARDLIKEAA